MTQNLQLFINDHLVDLSDDPIQLSFQINNLGDVKNQAGNFSKQFKLPLTQRNRQILGFPDDVKFTTDLPYTQYDVKLIQDGNEILPAGIGEIQSTDDMSADLVILSGNVDFFEAMGSQIYDLGDSTSEYTNYGALLVWQPYDHAWTVQNAASSQKKTAGWIWPVVDYGNISTDDYTEPINARQMRPGFFLHTAIDILVQSTGYSINPKSFLINEPLYKKLIVQFANDSFEHGTDYQNKADILGMIASIPVLRDVYHQFDSDNVGIIPFSSISSDPSQQWNGSHYISKQILGVSIKLTIPLFRLQGYVSSKHPTSVDITLLHESGPGDEVLATQTYDFTNWDYNDKISGSGSGIIGFSEFRNVVLSGEVDLDIGDKLSVQYEFKGDHGNYNNNTLFTIFAGTTLTITSKNTDVLYTQMIQCERIFPDVATKDLVKDTLQRFGIICQTDSVTKQVTLLSMRDIVNNIPFARDWTSKCIKQGKQVSYTLGDYNQVNWLRYQFDDSVPITTLPREFADDHIDISNKTFNQSGDIINSIFAPSANRAWYGDSIAQILKIDDTSDTLDFTISTEPRILVDQKLDLRTIGGGKSVTFTDGDGTDIVINDVVSVPYFFKSAGEFNNCFCDKEGQKGLRKTYYPEFERILKQTKKVVRYFMLTPRDILELDLTIPVYLEQDSCYYYINKIDSWRKGLPTKVELIKLY